MLTITEPGAMRAWSAAERATGHSIALVPTMGSLHDGHMQLVAEARGRAERVVVSIFVNPMQFNRRDDFDRYPRDLAADAALCDAAGVDAIYAPRAAAMYPEGFQTAVAVDRLAEPLCGANRPGHFRGVTTVVTKLFHAVAPDFAVFGEKDFQQLAIVRRMTADLDFGIEIVGVPTIREPDGLAMSSRNRLLDAEARRAAVCVPRAILAAEEAVAGGERRTDAVRDAAVRTIASEPRARLEYAELRDPETLEVVEEVGSATLLALAVWVGDVRLIDNRVLHPGRPLR